MDVAVKAAKEAFKTWSKVPPVERGRLLDKLADLYERIVSKTYWKTRRATPLGISLPWLYMLN